jgi:hypothetical protein
MYPVIAIKNEVLDVLDTSLSLRVSPILQVIKALRKSRGVALFYF